MTWSKRFGTIASCVSVIFTHRRRKRNEWHFGFDWSVKSFYTTYFNPIIAKISFHDTMHFICSFRGTYRLSRHDLKTHKKDSYHNRVMHTYRITCKWDQAQTAKIRTQLHPHCPNRNFRRVKPERLIFEGIMENRDRAAPATTAWERNQLKYTR